MAAPAKEEKAPEADAQTEKPSKSKSKLIILLAFISVILLELIVAILLLPRQSDVAAMPNPGSEEIEPFIPSLDPSKESLPKIGERIAFPIADPFRVSFRSADTTTTINTKIVLEYNKTDDKDFTDKFPQVELPVRNDIEIILRQSTPQEIDQSNHKILCNKILKAVNGRLQAPLVKNVFALDFRAETM